MTDVTHWLRHSAATGCGLGRGDYGASSRWSDVTCVPCLQLARVETINEVAELIYGSEAPVARIVEWIYRNTGRTVLKP